MSLLHSFYSCVKYNRALVVLLPTPFLSCRFMPWSDYRASRRGDGHHAWFGAMSSMQCLMTWHVYPEDQHRFSHAPRIIPSPQSYLILLWLSQYTWSTGESSLSLHISWRVYSHYDDLLVARHIAFKTKTVIVFFFLLQLSSLRNSLSDGGRERFKQDAAGSW